MNLYRDVHRALRRVPDEKDRAELRVWAREEFKRNKSQHEEVTETVEASSFVLN